MLTAETLNALLNDEILPSRMPDAGLLTDYLRTSDPRPEPICLSFGETWSQVAPGLAARLATEPVHSHGYQLSQYGLPALRLLVRDQLRREHRLPDDSQAGRDYEVAVGWTGTRSAMFDFGRMILDQDAPSDAEPVVVVAGPSWDYEGVYGSLGYRVRYHHLRPESGFRPDAAELRQLFAEIGAGGEQRPALLVVNAQHNPTAVNWDAEFVTEAVSIAAESGAAILIDDAYYAVHDDDIEPTSALSILLGMLPGLPKSLRRRWLAVRSFGKQFHSNGWGIGALTADPKILDALVNRYRLHHGLMYGGCYQHAMRSWLADEASREFLVQQRRSYRSRRKMIGDYLTSRLGYPADRVHVGECSSYLMFAVPEAYAGLDDPAERFRLDCFAATGVLFAPAWPWPFIADRGPGLPWVRMFIGPSSQTITTALDRLADNGFRYDMAVSATN
ncbi:pyridoxal phosphate-dependent aminotransferase [Stackebrandtia nassauensis]|uniref:Aminotransferase class I and II n=1 Tax=Stackebrandtia nassauensis (strain DSM 44728 / CIP 108903 / NRRL B-16338 / NBRC 102104 / LLR-40K-21) TaxID=446470 RepID=D3Q619_STANL|nr:pyridoxal phosphate-dependent aminotransferase [Stackebrandtia nassauensis]ADD42194.1 aminotransferase class I and II [Stackebrandtia nassauensis DSM 44728]